MIAYDSNEDSLHTGVVRFIWYAADSAHALGQLVAIDYSDSTPDVAFTYDRLGRQLTVTDVLGTRTNVYDALNLLEERHPDGTALVRAYDPFGRASGISLGPDYAVGYGYDELGRFSTVSVSNGATFTYSYVPNSSLLAGYTNTLGLAVAYEYEPLRDLKTLVSNSWGTNTISTFAYDYDAVGRRTQRVDSGLTTNIFAYNTRSELINAVMGTNTYAYSYDPIGNRTETSENSTTNVYVSNELNQYTFLNPDTTNSTTFVYDSDGNVIQYGDLAFFWDAENRLLGVASNGIALVTNRYDFMSRRIEKATSTATNAFVYDGWNLIRETIDSNSTSATNDYVWGLDLAGTLQDAGGIGGLLMQRHSDSNSPWFSVCDANGNISDLLDEDGALSAHYEYDSYGNTAVQFGTSSVSNPFRFSSKYNDYGDAGLYYYGYRFYSSKIGKWLSRDSLLELSFQMLSRKTFQASNVFYNDDGISPYIFAFDNPIDGFDVLGLDGEKIPCGNCLICVDKNRSGDGQSPYHIHWNCGTHRRPHSCRGRYSADWPSGKGREGSPDVPNNIRKCLENTKWRFESIEVSVPAPGDCCQNETIDEAVYVGAAVGTCVVVYAVYKVFKTCLGGAVGFLVAGPPGAVGGVSFCLATP